MKPACPNCGFIHTSFDTIAVGRFTGTVRGYRAASGGPTRETREEADADECENRIRRSTANVPQRHITPPGTVAPEPTPAKDGLPVEHLETRVALERGAREQAWIKFLGEIAQSLMVWQIDEELRDHIEPVTAWMKRLAAELAQIAEPIRSKEPTND